MLPAYFPIFTLHSQLSKTGNCEMHCHSELDFKYTHREIIFEILENKPNLNCYYTFPIDLAPIDIPSGAKSIG